MIYKIPILRVITALVGIICIAAMTITAMCVFGQDSALLGTGTAAIGAIVGMIIRDTLRS